MYPRDREPSQLRKIFVWLVFNVGLGLAALVFEWYLKTQSVAAEAGAPPDLMHYLQRKDVFLICTAIAGDAFGNLASVIDINKKEWSGRRVWLMIFCVVMIIISLGLFCYPPKSYTTVFYVIFFLTFVIGFFSKIYS